MKLEQQVCSLGLAKRLKELGVRQESVFYWNEYQVSKDPKKWKYHLQPDFREKRSTSAFTVAELGEMVIKDSNVEWNLYCSPKTGKWIIYSAGTPGYHAPDLPQFVSDTEADARAKMLIHLIEKGILNPKESA